MSQTTISSISLGYESILFIVTTTRRFHVQDVESGARALQFVGRATETNLMLSLFDEAEPLSETTFELVTSATSDFRNVTLGDRDVMVILTSEAPIKVNNFKVGNESILFIGQMSTEIGERLARRFEMRFTPEEPGIYCSRFHPGDDVFVSIRNDLWFLAGQLHSLGVQRQVQNYSARQNQPGNHDTTMSDALGLSGRQPASSSAIQALPKEKIGVSAPSELGEEVCPICLGPLEATKLRCGHWFHFDCIEPWLKRHDSCPKCRISIDSTDT